MPIKFNSLLNQVGIADNQVILVRHKDLRAEKSRSPFEMWRSNMPDFEEYQREQSLANRPKFERAPIWASFVGTPRGETVFVGLYNSTGRGGSEERDIYDLSRNAALDEFAGKLFIEWGDGARAWVQRADRQNKTVTEIRLKFEEDPFPGALNFIEPLSKLESLPFSWVEFLKRSWGIYLLTCPTTREQYVGSVTGKEGFWQRWLGYARTGHGGNVALKSRDPSDYQVCILELAGSAVTDLEILEMETRWKRKLQSRDMGLNRN